MEGLHAWGRAWEGHNNHAEFKPHRNPPFALGEKGHVDSFDGRKILFINLLSLKRSVCRKGSIWRTVFLFE
ncbi:unnamed protein product [Victoria cruziana]